MKQTQGIYLISMVAETLEMHPQTLRKYERAGFVEPLRMGTMRAYSDEDVGRLRLIKHFVEGMGLNLAGVRMALTQTSELLELRRHLSSQSGSTQGVAESVRQVDRLLGNLGVRVVKRSARGEPSPPTSARYARASVGPGLLIEFQPSH